MSGSLIGLYFKAVMSPLLAARELFPADKARVDAMADDAWYPWDDFKLLVATVASELSYVSLCHVGKQVMATAAPLFREQGYASPDDFLSDWYALVATNVRDVPEADAPRTIEYSPGYAVLEASDAQPLALVEGYVRGAVDHFGGYLVELRAEVLYRGDERRFRWTVHWGRR